MLKKLLSPFSTAGKRQANGIRGGGHWYRRYQKAKLGKEGNYEEMGVILGSIGLGEVRKGDV